ncbi:hypothetical protein ILUMI_03516 [Ignelater luminosus]|uniref:Uncharacterized protein n=1 Tax=Ignelater luminosus TaxID=2038154 RepID=A0A8K0GFF5_IGNLU|nr:hypothetical protein ILUMI_03516 [Ignelater luminosus]
MSIFVRFLDIECQIFREELLAILPLKGNTRGEDLFKVIDEFITKSNISYDKMVSLSTDGAPAMIGKEKGVVKRIRDKNSGLISYQCIIHQAAFCEKLSATLKEVMDSFVKLINFMRSHSALQHRHFKEFLSECDSVYSNILQHNNVRWLSKGQVIERFWLIKEQVTSFLQNLDTQGAKKHFEFITNERNMVVVAFLKDILKYLNALNTELQGNGKLICDLIQSVSAFRRKLGIFEKDIAEQEFIHFPTILEFKKNEFATRFQDFAEMGKLSSFLKSPFEVDVAAEWTDVAAKLFNLSKPSLQMEIIDLQEDVSLQMYKTVSTAQFWAKHVPEKYENCKTLAINLATMFGSTYICETSFSKMNFLKNKYRSRLTDAHLEDTLRICCSSREPNHKKLAQDHRSHEGNSQKYDSPVGRRIVDIGHLWSTILKSGRHKPFDCCIIDMDLVYETKVELDLLFMLQCRMCGLKIIASLNGDAEMYINTAATAGIEAKMSLGTLRILRLATKNINRNETLVTRDDFVNIPILFEDGVLICNTPKTREMLICEEVQPLSIKVTNQNNPDCKSESESIANEAANQESELEELDLKDQNTEIWKKAEKERKKPDKHT